MTTNTTIARNLRDAAFKRNLSAADLARFAGADLAEVERLWEKDEVEFETLDTLAAFLGLDVDGDLLDGLRYAVFHHPDGGEDREIARFERSILAQFFAESLIARPKASIRLIEVRDLRTGSVLFRGGWAA